MTSDEYEREKKFWIDKFAQSDRPLSDEELKRVASLVDHSDFRQIFGNRLKLHYSLRASLDAEKLATAVREFDRNSSALGGQMKAIARAQLWLALASLVIAAVAAVYAPWDEFYKSWQSIIR